jgi:hypothetical protein
MSAAGTPTCRPRGNRPPRPVARRGPAGTGASRSRRKGIRPKPSQVALALPRSNSSLPGTNVGARPARPTPTDVPRSPWPLRGNGAKVANNRSTNTS